MYFQTLEAVLHMDGHGVFVWPAYLIGAIVVSVLLLAPGRRQRSFLNQLKAELKRQPESASSPSEDP